MKGQLVMKKFRKLYSRKGFTLVECIVAIAVFAVLTAMVLMIMSNTVLLSKKAGDAETDLNGLVQNVVEDNVGKVYGDDSGVLKMNFGSNDPSDPDFLMTYTTIDGYRNYIECPHCHKLANNLDYMQYIYGTTLYKNWPSATDKQEQKVSFWFGEDSSTSYYQCPNCDKTFTESDAALLECQSCGLVQGTNYTAADGSSKTAVFVYNKYSGSYSCPNCGGGNVKRQGIADAVTADSDFMVSGISPNAIRYGTVERVSDADMPNLVKLSGADTNNATMKIDYTPNPNATKPGVYTLTFDVSSTIPDVSGSPGTALAEISLPGSYICKIISTAENGSSGHAYIWVKDSDDFTLQDHTSTLYIQNIAQTAKSNLTVKFMLVNYENNHSFEDDYANISKYKSGTNTLSGNTALGLYWFGVTSNTVSITDGARSGTITPLAKT